MQTNKITQITSMNYLTGSDYKEYCNKILSLRKFLPDVICKQILDFTEYNKQYYLSIIHKSPFYSNNIVLYKKIKTYYGKLNTECQEYYWHPIRMNKWDWQW